MGNFRSGGGFGRRSRDRDDDGDRGRGRSRGGFGRSSGGDRGGRGFGRRDSGRVEMTDVTCDKCGKECQVPFRPSGDKPVLCSDCFRKNDSGSSPRSSSGFGSGAGSDQLSQINKKLDKILKVLNDLELDVDEEEVEEDSDEDSEDEDEEDSQEKDGDDDQDEDDDEEKEK